MQETELLANRIEKMIQASETRAADSRGKIAEKLDRLDEKLSSTGVSVGRVEMQLTEHMKLDDVRFANVEQQTDGRSTWMRTIFSALFGGATVAAINQFFKGGS